MHVEREEVNDERDAHENAKLLLGRLGCLMEQDKHANVKKTKEMFEMLVFLHHMIEVGFAHLSSKCTTIGTREVELTCLADHEV